MNEKKYARDKWSELLVFNSLHLSLAYLFSFMKVIMFHSA